jgi:divinyl protochlorophyllide a 8-vinyl-reductase
MVKAPTGYLRRPAGSGFMAPGVVRDLCDIVLRNLGQVELDAVLLEAQLHRIPGPVEPVREDKALRLHQAVKRRHPVPASAMLAEAGAMTADGLLTTQASSRAQTMLAGSPWPIAAWLLGRWAAQHAWTFAGSARFTVVNALEYTLEDNPLHRGETGGEMACHWHRGLFQRLFQRMVDSDLECREPECSVAGAPCCRFLIARP